MQSNNAPSINRSKKKKRTFSETRIAALIFSAIALVIIILPIFLWSMQPYHKLHVWILDKTVPTQEYREHRGTMWALNYYRITDKKIDHSYYRYKTDYYGFYPLTEKEFSIKDLVHASPNPDLILCTDTYGVYRDDYWIPNKKGNRSPLIYGGLTREDIFMLRKNLKDQTTLITSFNTFAQPTDEGTRKQYEKMIGVEWKRWMGRFFINLERDKEVAVWMVDNWEEQHDAVWEFTGPGFVLCSDWDQVEVMEEAVHFYKDKDIYFKFLPPYTEEFQSTKDISYYYWFDFIQPMEETEILAQYTMEVTEEGQELLQSLGLDSVFPAITRKITTDYTAYYLAGDFEDHKTSSFLWHVYGLDTLRKWFSLDFRGEAYEYYWRGYLPFMKKVLQDVVAKRETFLPPVEKKDVEVKNGLHRISKTEKKSLQVYSNDTWEPFFVKGINLGMALPGYWFPNFPEEDDVYYSWFEKIGEMKANTVRVYTLIHPAFYRALYLYNLDHPKEPIYLLQGIWPEEHPPEDDYWGEDYTQGFVREIQWGVDAIHGNAVIPKRIGRAYGRYIADVSPWTLAYLVGREFEAMEVSANNLINPGKLYTGTYIGVTEKATPTEAWIAWACDKTMEYETNTYQWQRPVSLVSWPTLDITEHESEWDDLTDKSNQFNDMEVVDIRHFVTTKACEAGFFGSYHIYPNYPDFMNNEFVYQSYTDEQGQFMYGGYLEEFMRTHGEYPALVAEFGMATGMGTAHENPNGLHHGGVTEKEQGEMTVRMMKAVKNQNYIGGCIFEWMDEWAKKTWTTESFMIPYEHHVYWHNVICPEQNYGILANETIKPQTPHLVIEEDTNEIVQKMEISNDASYIYLDMYFDRPISLDQFDIKIGIDTYDKILGSYRYSPSLLFHAPTGMEFLLHLSKEGGTITVNPGYNIGRMKFSSQIDYTGQFESINPIINKERTTKNGRYIPEIRDNGSTLSYGDFKGSTHHYYFESSNVLHIRIPWGRLNVTDPTSRTVLDDIKKYNYYPDRDTLNTKVTTGFFITTVLQDSQGTLLDIFPGSVLSSKDQSVRWETLVPYTWDTWTWEIPPYQQRLKDSWGIVREYFQQFDEGSNPAY
ncbi:MAG: hypothetical protein PHI40_05530 [Caldisericia bacterium]|nr:hypothetical protein [Caldisericia bacterium]